jgi:type VI secretion system secreted protein Hcp
MLTREFADMKQRIRLAWLAVACLGLASTVAAADTFMLVPGVAGDSVAKGHEGWLRVSNLEWEAEAESSWTRGGGAGVGQPDPGKLMLLLASGLWSREFIRLITTGGSIPKVVIDHVATDGRPLFRMSMEDLFITRYRIATASKDLPQDIVEGVFKSLKIEYYAVDSTGKVVSNGQDWNVPSGKSVSIN